MWDGNVRCVGQCAWRLETPWPDPLIFRIAHPLRFASFIRLPSKYTKNSAHGKLVCPRKPVCSKSYFAFLIFPGQRLLTNTFSFLVPRIFRGSAKVGIQIEEIARKWIWSPGCHFWTVPNFLQCKFHGQRPMNFCPNEAVMCSWVQNAVESC